MKKINQKTKIEFKAGTFAKPGLGPWKSVHIEHIYNLMINYIDTYFPDYNYIQLSEKDRKILNDFMSNGIYVVINSKRILSMFDLFQHLHKNGITKKYSYENLINIYELLSSSDQNVRKVALSIIETMSLEHSEFIKLATSYSFTKNKFKDFILSTSSIYQIVSALGMDTHKVKSKEINLAIKYIKLQGNY